MSNAWWSDLHVAEAQKTVEEKTNKQINKKQLKTIPFVIVASVTGTDIALNI